MAVMKDDVTLSKLLIWTGKRENEWTVYLKLSHHLVWTGDSSNFRIVLSPSQGDNISAPHWGQRLELQLIWIVSCPTWSHSISGRPLCYSLYFLSTSIIYIVWFCCISVYFLRLLMEIVSLCFYTVIFFVPILFFCSLIINIYHSCVWSDMFSVLWVCIVNLK